MLVKICEVCGRIEEDEEETKEQDADYHMLDICENCTQDKHYQTFLNIW